MKRIATIVLVFSLMMVSSCVRRPGSYGKTQSSRIESEDKDVIGMGITSSRENGTMTTRSTRAGRTIHSATHDASLPAKVQQLAKQIERKFKAGSYTVDDIERWANLYLKYTLEYSLSTQNLTDEQCESIEFNLGKIAGSVYKNGVVPVLNEIDKISEGIDGYEERSKKWDGAAERGFKSAADDMDY